MDRDEAMRVLSRYRPGETDRGDLRMAEAFAMLQKDAKLSAWFKKHCHEQPWLNPPDAAAGEIGREKPEAGRQSVSGRFFAVFLLLAIAAAVIWKLLPGRQVNHLADYRDRMARLVQRAYPLKVAATDQREVADYFAGNDGATNYEVPAGMENFTTLGAAVFTWNNQTVSLMGLRVPQSQIVYLFIAPATAFEDAPATNAVAAEKVAGFATLTWLNGRYVYLLAGPDEKVLRSYVK